MTGPYTIAILEDNADRAARMRLRLEERFPQYPLRIFSGFTSEMTEWLAARQEQLLVVSLDHDLELLPGENGKCQDPGCGRDVADCLSRLAPRCTVIIHSTNVPAAIGMAQVLDDAGWSTRRITPYGDLEWVDELWFPAMREAILGRALAETQHGSLLPQG